MPWTTSIQGVAFVGMNKPTVKQRIGYDLGRTLPESLHEWVRNDLVGPGAEARYLIRFLVPTLPFFLLVFLLPGESWIKLAMLVMMVVPFVIFTVALSYVYRRFRLVAHDMDPELLEKTKHRAQERVMYERRFGHQ